MLRPRCENNSGLRNPSQSSQVSQTIENLAVRHRWKKFSRTQQGQTATNSSMDRQQRQPAEPAASGTGSRDKQQSQQQQEHSAEPTAAGTGSKDRQQSQQQEGQAAETDSSQQLQEQAATTDSRASSSRDRKQEQTAAFKKTRPNWHLGRGARRKRK